MEDDENFSSLSIDDRLSHKHWKARLSAYEELARTFRQTTSGKDALFRDHFDSMRKAPVESNAAALDAALNALQAFVELSESATRYSHICRLICRLRPLVLTTLIEKGLGAARGGTKSRTLEILLEFVAVDAAEPNELGTFVTHKQPKLVASSINSMTEIVRNFGANTAGVKSIIKHIPAVFQHSDKNVRAEGTSLVLELARWIGPSINSFFDGLKPVQVKELQDQITKTAPDSGTVRPLRWRRCEQPTDSTTTGGVEERQAMPLGDELGESSGSMSAIIDSYSLSDPINVLDKIPAGFYEGLESTKWKDRKDALDSLLAVIKVPKIEEGQFGSLKLADVNVVVVTADAHCLAALAEGLRKGFACHRNEVISALLERCKEKNKTVTEALRAALDAMIHTISCAAELAEAYGPFLKHKNPQVKAETLAWISRALPRAFRQPQAKKEIKTISDIVIPCMDDGTSDVRDAAANVLAVLVKVGGEKQVTPFLDRLDKIKLAKVIDTSKGSQSTISAPEIPKVIPAPVAAPVHAPVKAKPPPQPSAPKTLATLSFSHSNERSLEVMRSLVGEEVISGLADANWKNRVSAIESIYSKFEIVFPAEVDSEILVRCFSCSPGWKESNFQVLGKVLSLLTLFSEKNSFSPEAASLLIPSVIEKFADPKLGMGVSLLLITITESIGLAFVCQCLEGLVSKQKSPKVLTELFNWLASSILDFGISGLDIQLAVSLSKTGITNSNVAIRTAALKMAVVLRCYLGNDLKSMYLDLPPAQMSIIDGEFTKVAAEPIPKPIKKIRSIGQASNQPGPCVPMDLDTAPAEDIIPRNDLTAALNELISELADPNWKIRKEAMDKALDLVNDFLSELKARYSDANKNLVAQALELTSAIAAGMGTALEKNGGLRVVVGPAAATLADNKPQIRAAAVKFLSAALAVGSLGSMASALSSLLAGESPNLRRELVTWLGENPASLTKCPDEERNALMLAVIGCLQDRTIEVRKAAVHFIDVSLDYIPGDALLRICQAAKPALLSQMKQIVDSHQPKTTTIPKTPQKTAAGVGTGRTPKKGDMQNEIPGKVFIIEDAQVKAARIDAESRGGLKWTFDAPRSEFCDLLKNQLQGNVSSVIIKLLFSEDFKDVVSGMTAIDVCITTGNEKQGLLANVDLILKYLTIRLFDTNTSVLIKTFDLIEHALGVIDESNLRLSEVEASSFLPQFVQRAGELKEPIKGRLRGIYRQLCRVYPASKIFVFLLDGLKSKSARARVECLNEMEVLISRNGLMVVQAPKHIPVIAGVISDRDSHVRSAALNVLVQLHELLGDSLYKHMTLTSQKDLDMFQERLRRFKDKTLPPEEDVEESNPFEEAVEKMQVSDPVPQVFTLDPAQFGSPAKRTIIPSVYGTPAYGNVAPTPALPITMNSFYQPASIEDPLERVIQLIGTSTDLECITALQRLDEFMATPLTLLPKIDALISVLVVRLHECTHTMMDMDATLKSRLCRYVTNALVLLVAEPTCISKIEISTLTMLIRETLLSLVSGQISQLEDRDQLGRALNVLLVKCLESADHNKSYRALLSLLEQAFRVPPTSDDKYSEYVMKCLWKLTKQLATTIQSGAIDVVELLSHIHHFFCSLPPMEWKTRAAQNLPLGDLPLRTVKTILHELATSLGDRIIPSVRQIDNAEQSFVTSYIRAMLSANNVDVSGLDFFRYPPAQVSEEPVSQLSVETLEDMLKDICSKICSKPNTRAGLLELYELQRQHPYAASFIDSYLEKLGNFFCKYIKRNLAHIEAELSRAPLESDASGAGAKIQMSMFGQGGMVGDESCKTTPDQPMMSPVRNRLDSPVANPRTPIRPSQGMEGTPSKDSTIISLKERLAKLRQGGEQMRETSPTEQTEGSDLTSQQRIRKVLSYQLDLEILHKWREVQVLQEELERGRQILKVIEKLIINGIPASHFGFLC
ncbi:hypothetical protein PSACC_01466 [Paramicrosporidium saccamoebae]|uniref:TOG domain-containing protein n=1 Tax=Paramicrosporidium saccamoebae TaxID=1246581 RepID=A0A2H9TLS2_9FUNG|nr:hypothetical protein PSACC_01466 [Paramicrosporidium saccamoebae]